ncbi:hypothetical protein Slala02_64320 [Streptomyces lavendulae subsp. lavendulae]|nr:hypothetical protein Slala01_67930 [Streptomyces lavendulae subsp. lavendulae]GLX30612.1 hypothetical protein Slala02_64320 [Streptomyces lavendulae subsp. lavendulae]
MRPELFGRAWHAPSGRALRGGFRLHVIEQGIAYAGSAKRASRLPAAGRGPTTPGAVTGVPPRTPGPPNAGPGKSR